MPADIIAVLVSVYYPHFRIFLAEKIPADKRVAELLGINRQLHTTRERGTVNQNLGIPDGNCSKVGTAIECPLADRGDASGQTHRCQIRQGIGNLVLFIRFLIIFPRTIIIVAKRIFGNVSNALGDCHRRRAVAMEANHAFVDNIQPERARLVERRGPESLLPDLDIIRQPVHGRQVIAPYERICTNGLKRRR